MSISRLPVFPVFPSSRLPVFPSSRLPDYHPAMPTHTEEHKVSGEGLVAKVKELVREGNVRRVRVKNDEGRVLFEFPLTVGVVGVALMPVWVALGAVAALAADYTVEIERKA
jgi:hypothetical protein